MFALVVAFVMVVSLLVSFSASSDFFCALSLRQATTDAPRKERTKFSIPPPEEIQVGREQLSKLIAEGAKGELSNFGIELIDVQLRRISYEASVEKNHHQSSWFAR